MLFSIFSIFLIVFFCFLHLWLVVLLQSLILAVFLSLLSPLNPVHLLQFSDVRTYISHYNVSLQIASLWKVTLSYGGTTFTWSKKSDFILQSMLFLELKWMLWLGIVIGIFGFLNFVKRNKFAKPSVIRAWKIILIVLFQRERKWEVVVQVGCEN